MTLASKRTATIILLGLVTLGQSCSINIGNPQPKDGGLYRTDDHANTWRQKTFIRTENKRRIALDDATIVSLQFDPQNSDRLYASIRDLGLWTTANRGEKWSTTGLKTGTYRCLSFDPKNDDVLYIASGSQVRKSLDQGKSWSIIYTEPQSGQAVDCLTVDPNRDNVLWAITTGGKVLRSSDYGANWTLVNTVKTLTGVLLIKIDPLTNGPVVFTKTRGIFSLDASGTQVHILSEKLSLYKGANTILDVEWIATTSETRWYIATRYGVLFTADGGASWQEISTLLNPNTTTIGNIAVHPTNPQELYLTTGRRLHHTTDGGASWAITTLPSTRTPTWLIFDPANTDRLYVGTFIPEKKK